MEIEEYNLPLKLNCLACANIQTPDGIQKVTIKYISFIEWDNIMNVEEFVKPEMFPESEKDIEKSVIVTRAGQNFIIQENIEDVAHMWGKYKIWKAKRSILLNNLSKN